ncbi:hypothetical protein PCG10_005979 [Penicillium crustosum]|uniref:Uncharacterized protein n=1 Tax=Penicillium crustosum TaxID=36656 RepID=A0A9P5KY13_PENCR|nr:uncharacterized protein N7487_003299 [Penicillium crustosum]KAF7524075.1 hypothetical protein PCG10_005979 [Penicillium crustosum]KAJ5419749.1 hypothetical protein N7487_003299 [Penicillium crustosum]
MEKISLETHNPLRQNAPTPPRADRYKEVSLSYPQSPTIEHSVKDDCTLQVSDRDCTLEFSDRDCNLELNQYANDKHRDKQAEAGVGPADENQADGIGKQPPAERKEDPESQSVTGTVMRHKSRRREWIIVGSALGAVVLLVVIIVPSVIFGTRQSRPQYKPPTNPYIP